MRAFAEFERSLILERQREGIAIAKAAGKYRGRRAKLTTGQMALKFAPIVEVIESGWFWRWPWLRAAGNSIRQIAVEADISTNTVLKLL